MRARSLIALLAGLLVVATACGSQANSYRTHVNRAETRYDPRLSKLERTLATAIANRRPAVAARAASSTSSVIGQLAQSVAAIHPPASMRARSARLATAYKELATSLDRLAAALRARAPKRVNSAIGSYNDARLDESSAIAALNAG